MVDLEKMSTGKAERAEMRVSSDQCFRAYDTHSLL